MFEGYVHHLKTDQTRSKPILATHPIDTHYALPISDTFNLARWRTPNLCCTLMIRNPTPPQLSLSFFFNDTATTEIYTLSLHDALPISWRSPRCAAWSAAGPPCGYPAMTW